jgi:PAS domain S-box-containing protein
MRLRLRTKIILICMAVFFLAIGASTMVNGIYFAKEYFQVRQSETFVIAHTLKSQLDRLVKMHIPLDQLVGFEEICRDIISEHAFLSYAMVVDPDGKILFHNDPDWHDQAISDRSILHSIKNGRETVQLFYVSKEAYYDFQIPVRGNQQEHIATIRTGFPRYIISNKTKTLAFYSIGVTLLSFAIGIILLVVFLELWVSKPVERLIRTIQNIRKEWSSSAQLVEIKSKDEIGQLARAFNEMAEELQETTVSKDFMNNIIDNMLNSLIIIDNKFRIQSVNQETLRLLGYTEDELVGEPIVKVFVKPRQSGTFNIDHTPHVVPMKAVEAEYISKGGEAIPVLFSSSIMETGTQELQGYICLAQDITEIKTLRGFMPICAACKKIRDDSGYWNQIESYIHMHSTAQLSHSMCPECAKAMYGNEEWFDEEDFSF